MKPLLIGLTGGIATGKSTIAAELERLGAEVISGDALGKDVVENSKELLAGIRARFGADVFDPGGALQRRVLGAKVFASPAHVKWLVDATFPEIHRLWNMAVEGTNKDVLVFDAALILEWGIEKEFDLLVVASAPRDAVIRRMISSGRLTESEVEARLASQISPEQKAQRADVVLVNDGTTEQLVKKTREFWMSRVKPELDRRRDLRHDRSSNAR
jgi:dephospho-CoA kinase